MRTNDAEKKRKKEQKVSDLMIHVYCRGHKHTKGKELCEDCKALQEYATMRLAKCPFMETKTFCSQCKVHCYKPDMREKMKNVMRYSGPRMLLYHPIMAIVHVIQSLKEKHHMEEKKK